MGIDQYEHGGGGGGNVLEKDNFYFGNVKEVSAQDSHRFVDVKKQLVF